MATDRPSPVQDQRSSRLHLASLLDLSSRITEADPIDILNVAVLSLMGRLRVFRSCVLVPHGDHLIAEPRLCKGVQPLSIRMLSLTGIEVLDPSIGEHKTLVDAGLERLVPLTASTGLIAVLALGPTIGDDADPDGTTAYLELSRTIIGTAVHNADMVRSLVQTSKELESRTLMITSLFETARDFTGAKTRDELLRIMSYRLMGQLMVSTFGVFLTEPLDGAEVIVNRVEANDLADLYDDVIAVHDAIRVDDLPEGGELRSTLESAGLGLLAPMTVHGVKKGVLVTGTKLNGQAFSQEELSFLEAIGNTAMTAIENERLIQEELIKQRLESELSIAAEIQQRLLPDQLPDLPGFDLAAASQTSRVIGGDYYDVIRLDQDRTLIAIADVAGKGIPAALLMANVQAALKVLAKSDLPLTQLVDQVNALVCENTEPEVFITMFLAVVNTRTRGIEYVNAGHNPPILIHDEDVALLSEGGVLTGVVPDPPPYSMGIGTLSPGDLLVLYTDGVTEARRGMEEFGLGALVETLHRIKGKGARAILEDVQREIDAFSDSVGLDDDTSLVVLKALDQ